MRLLLWILLAAAVLAALHFLALWAERRGWIYYKNKRASPGTRAGAFLEMQALVDPKARYVIESQSEDSAEEDESGDPPSAGDDDAADERSAT